MLIMQGNFTMIYYFLEESILNIYESYLHVAVNAYSNYILLLDITIGSAKNIHTFYFLHTLPAYILKTNSFVDLLILYRY